MLTKLLFISLVLSSINMNASVYTLNITAYFVTSGVYKLNVTGT